MVAETGLCCGVGFGSLAGTGLSVAERRARGVVAKVRVSRPWRRGRRCHLVGDSIVRVVGGGWCELDVVVVAGFGLRFELLLRGLADLAERFLGVLFWGLRCWDARLRFIGAWL